MVADLTSCVHLLKQIHFFISVTSNWYTIFILNFPSVFLNPINRINNTVFLAYQSITLGDYNSSLKI
jgi:hypothetical protein